MKQMLPSMKGEEGSVLAVSFFILVLLTIIGIAASRTSHVEVQIAGNEKDHQVAFYAAEAGIDHLRALLKSRLISNNIANLNQGNTISWDFAINGLDPVLNAPAATDTRFEGGVPLIQGATLGRATYTVTVWNNRDGGGALDDTDGIIIARSDATGPTGASASIEIALLGQATGESISGYQAQAGQGSGKSYSSDDLNAIDFSTASAQI